MRKDKLENFVNKNRPDLDNHEPGLGNWEAIQNRRKKVNAPRKVNLPLWNYIGKAAVFGGLIFGLYFLLQNNLGQDAWHVEVNERNPLPSVIQELENHYQNEFDRQWTSFSEKLQGEGEILNDIEEELELLNREKRALLKEFGRDLSNEKVVEELIQVYRMRLNILQDVMNLISPESDQTINNETDELNT